MCSRYEPPTKDQQEQAFGHSIVLPRQGDLWPGYTGPFVRNGIDDNGDPSLEVLPGIFGLLPMWAKDTKLARHTYNARTETVSSKPSFRYAWKNAHHCIIPAAAIYEPNWRSGKAVPTRISRTDGGIMSLAGLWEKWISPDGNVVHSFTMLTINADDHPFMRNYHKKKDEKRMLVILPNGVIKDWLNASPAESMDFMRQYPADRLTASNNAHSQT